MTIRIGRYKFGWAPVSMIIVFIVTSICAVVSACNEARAEWPVPLSDLILVKEIVALAITLGYGIILHLILAQIKRK